MQYAAGLPVSRCAERRSKTGRLTDSKPGVAEGDGVVQSGTQLGFGECAHAGTLAVEA